MSKNSCSGNSRRHFLITGGALLGMAALGAPALPGCAPKAAPLEVPATEELMQEHGLLRRLLLLFDEAGRRLKCCQEMPPGALAEAAAITRSFVQDHHEKLEEEHLFPPFEKAGKMVALVKILRLQHEAGRKMMDYLARHAAPGPGRNFVQRAQLEATLTMFTRMYRPHAAREDTVLFPALRLVLPPAEFSALGKRVAEEEQARFGREGFSGFLSKIMELEKVLSLHDLEEFTPRL